MKEERVRGSLHITNRLQMWRHPCQTKNKFRPKEETLFEKIIEIGKSDYYNRQNAPIVRPTKSLKIRQKRIFFYKEEQTRIEKARYGAVG